MRNSKLRIGIAGLGGVARNNHIPALLERDDVQIAACAEKNSERIGRIKDLFGFPLVFQDYVRMYEEAELDAVYICLPPFLHLDASMKAMERGLHVLCEKPVGRSSNEASVLKREAEKRGVIFLPGFKLRWNNNFSKARQILRSGILGKMIQVEATYITPGPYISWDPKSEWYLEKSNMGALSDIGSHLIDLLNYLLKPGAVKLSAICSKGFIDYDIPTNIACMLRFQDESIGSLNFGWRGAEDILRLSFHGMTASLTVTKRTVEVLYKSTDPVDRTVQHLKWAFDEMNTTLHKIRDRIQGRKVGPEDRSMTGDFLKAVRGSRCLRTSGEDAIFVHRVTEAIAKSLESWDKVEI